MTTELYSRPVTRSESFSQVIQTQHFQFFETLPGLRISVLLKLLVFVLVSLVAGVTITFIKLLPPVTSHCLFLPFEVVFVVVSIEVGLRSGKFSYDLKKIIEKIYSR